MTVDAEERRRQAHAALAGPDFSPLWAAARKRLEGNGLSIEGTPLRLAGLSNTQRRSIAGLLATSAAGGGPMRVRLAALDATLRSGAASIDLLTLLAALGGPLRDRRAERTATHAAREDAWASVSDHPILDQHPELRGWVTTIRRTGSATRVAGSPVAGGALVLGALDVLARLPAQNVPLAVVAAEATGDAHALDRGKPLGTLVAGALAVLDTEADDGDSRMDWPTAGAYWWRRRWARAGVVCDDLSVSVLALNLPVTSSGDVIGDSIYEHRMAGEPLRLTLRQLAIGEINVASGATVHLCENPSVVAQAAALLEDRSAALMCVEGQPNSAAHALLGMLVSGGSSLRYHGDFDWDGLRIGAEVIARYGAQPWRFSAPDYLEAAARGRLTLPEPRTAINTPWSPDLPTAMAAERVAIHEEQVLAPMIDDLGR